MNMRTWITVSILFLAACNNKEPEYDASGTFEATETIVSAQANGVLQSFTIEEGQRLDSGQAAGYVDSTQLHLKKQQIQAQIDAILGKKPKTGLQTAALRAQLAHAQQEQQRLSRLVKADAATPKQLDDANAQIAVIEKQIAAQQSSLDITNSNLNQETKPLTVQLKVLADQLEKCVIINPVKGTVLAKYAAERELTATGKPLYKIADLSTMILRAYITGDQFATIRPGQKVRVFADGGNGGTKSYEGIVEWINEKAEFTPKTIQTKNERANLVYAVKIRVKNDGVLKVGMYGAVGLDPEGQRETKKSMVTGR
jgi:HlyD family secretion protein